MAPAANSDLMPTTGAVHGAKAALAPNKHREVLARLNNPTTRSRLTAPLEYSGSLDSYEYFDPTTATGREFPKLKLSEILHDDDKVRDLAIMVSERCVVFFRDQDLSIDDQKLLAQRLGELSGKPETSKLYVHPAVNGQANIPIDSTAGSRTRCS